MTYRTRREAVAAAAAVRGALPGGWRVRVWDNLGWHWELRKGDVKLWPAVCGLGYMAMVVSYPGEQFGGGPWVQSDDGGVLRTPQEAVAYAASLYRDYAAQERRRFDGLDAGLADAQGGL